MTKPARWDELDLLRGVAGVLMVMNHTGYKWLSEVQLADPVVNALVFAGSCAPVVFFTASGVGYGLGSGATSPPDHRGLLRKVAILLAADALLWLTPDQPYGLDFLGFIGLSMLALHPLRYARHGLRWAIVGIAAITVLRYGIGELVKGRGVGQGVLVALGIDAVDGVAYPVLPWLAYGLTGFVLGAMAKRWHAWVRMHLAGVLLGAAIVVAGASGAAWVLVASGRSIHRWGYVSLAFYAASFAAIAAAVALALAVGRYGGRTGRWLLELRGLASLALVPLHYAAIVLVAMLIAVADLDRWTWIAATIVTLAISFGASRAIERMFEQMIATPRAWLPAALLVGVAIAFVAKWSLLVGHAGDAAVLAVTTIGQLLLCARFAVDGARAKA